MAWPSKPTDTVPRATVTQKNTLAREDISASISPLVRSDLNHGKVLQKATEQNKTLTCIINCGCSRIMMAGTNKNMKPMAK